MLRPEPDRRRDRDEKISLAPLTPEEALRALLGTPPPDGKRRSDARSAD